MYVLTYFFNFFPGDLFRPAGMINTRPSEELSGTCDLLYLMIQFKIIHVEQLGERLYYDNQQRHITLKKCAHVRSVTEDILMIHMKNDSFITLRTPKYWHTLLPYWISYIRQIPLWQVILRVPYPPMSYAIKSGNRVLLALRDNFLEFDGKDAMELKQAVRRSGRILRMGPWILEFETLTLAKAWERALEKAKEQDMLEIPEEGDVSLEHVQGSSKLENQRLIDKYRKIRRKSVDEWEDSDEEEAHFQRVMEFISLHAPP